MNLSVGFSFALTYFVYPVAWVNVLRNGGACCSTFSLICATRKIVMKMLKVLARRSVRHAHVMLALYIDTSTVFYKRFVFLKINQV